MRKQLIKTAIIVISSSLISIVAIYADVEPWEEPLFQEYYDKKEQTGGGETMVKIPYDGADIFSQAPFFAAAFASISNPHIEVAALTALNQDSKDYASMLTNCFQNHPTMGIHYASLTQDEKDVLHRLFTYYVYLVNVTRGDDEPFSTFNPVAIPCDFSNEHTVAAMSHTLLGRALKPYGTNSVYSIYLGSLVSKFSEGGFIVNLDELFLIWMIAAVPELLNTETSHKDAAFDGFVKRTSPSVIHINKFLAAGVQHNAWNTLGMNAKWDWGMSGISSYLAWAYYEHPVLTSFIPIIGSGMDTINAWYDFEEGKDMYGADVNKHMSAAIAALNFAAFTFDVIGPTAVSYAAVNDMRKLIRTKATLPEMKVILDDFKELLKSSTYSGQAIGAKSYEVAHILGHPKRIWESLWNRSLFPAATGSKWGDKLWKNGLDEVAEKITKNLKNEASHSYEEIIADIAAADKQTAIEMNLIDADAYGETLEEALVTAIIPGEKYEQFYQILKDFAQQGGELNNETIFSSLSINIATQPNGVKVWRHQVFGYIDEEEIPMTMVTIYDQPLIHVDGAETLGWITHQDPFMFDFDPNLTKLAKVRAHQQELFSKLMANNLSRKEVIDIVAELHWWEANLAAYSRGTNGIADAMAKSILHAKGIKIGQWKPTVSPDFYAFTLNKDDFVKNYPAFFQQDPADINVMIENVTIGGKIVDDGYKGIWKKALKGYREFYVNAQDRNVARGFALEHYLNKHRDEVNGVNPENWSPAGHPSIPMQILVKKELPNGDLELVGAAAAMGDVSPDLAAQPELGPGDPIKVGFEFEIPDELNLEELRLFMLDPVSGAEKELGNLPALCEGEIVNWDFDLAQTSLTFTSHPDLREFRYPTPCKVLTFPGFSMSSDCVTAPATGGPIHHYFSFRSTSPYNNITWKGGGTDMEPSANPNDPIMFSDAKIFYWDPDTENGAIPEEPSVAGPGTLPYAEGFGYVDAWKQNSALSYQAGNEHTFYVPAFQVGDYYYGFVGMHTNVHDTPFICSDTFTVTPLTAEPSP